MEEDIPQLSVVDWWELHFEDNAEINNHHRRRGRLALLDLRSLSDWYCPEACCRSTTSSSSSSSNTDGNNHHVTLVHIPFQELADRSFELPPRDVPFVIIVATCEDIPKAQALLKPHNHHTHHPSKRQLIRFWKVVGVIVATDNVNQQQANELGLVRNGDIGPVPPTAVLSNRLWKPDPLLPMILWPLLRQTLETIDTSSSKQQQSQPSDPNGNLEIWDLGSGAGRDVCFLAQSIAMWYHHQQQQQQQPQISADVDTHIVPQVRVIGIDQRYRGQDHIEQSRQFWTRSGVGTLTDAVYMDLQQVSEFANRVVQHQQSSSTRIACFYAVRYWNRSLVEWIRWSPQLQPGTLFAMSQFGKAHVGQVWEFAHPKEKHVLERNELADLFSGSRSNESLTAESNMPQQESAPKWTILLDQVVTDSDHGRTLIQFVARREA